VPGSRRHRSAPRLFACTVPRVRVREDGFSPLDRLQLPRLRAQTEHSHRRRDTPWARKGSAIARERPAPVTQSRDRNRAWPKTEAVPRRGRASQRPGDVSYGNRDRNIAVRKAPAERGPPQRGMRIPARSSRRRGSPSSAVFEVLDRRRRPPCGLHGGGGGSVSDDGRFGGRPALRRTPVLDLLSRRTRRRQKNLSKRLCAVMVKQTNSSLGIPFVDPGNG